MRSGRRIWFILILGATFLFVLTRAMYAGRPFKLDDVVFMLFGVFPFVWIWWISGRFGHRASEAYSLELYLALSWIASLVIVIINAEVFLIERSIQVLKEPLGSEVLAESALSIVYSVCAYGLIAAVWFVLGRRMAAPTVVVTGALANSVFLLSGIFLL